MADPHGATTGILILPEDPMIVASRPIVHTDFSGAPRGVVIMGRFLDTGEVAHLATLTYPSLQFIGLDDPALPSSLLSDLQDSGEKNPEIVRANDRNTISGYALLRDIYGNDALILRITQPRDIYQQGVDTTYQFILIFLAVCLGFGVVIMLLLDRLVLSRLSELSQQVNTISRERDASKRVEITGNDEFSNLAVEINLMLETIYTTGQQLMVSEERFREITDLLPQIFFELDTAGSITYVNKFGMDNFGLTRKEMDRKPGAEHFIAPEEHPHMFDRLKEIANGGKSPGEVYTLIKPDGTRISAIIYTAPIVRDGILLGFRGSAFDITERIMLEKALTESEEKYRALTENTPDLLFSADLEGVVTYISPRSTSMDISRRISSATLSSISSIRKNGHRSQKISKPN